jgi:DNA-binding winged helix-turn-helix (wHTH) protein
MKTIPQTGGKGVKMRVHDNIHRSGRFDAALAGPDSIAGETRSASIHSLDSSTRAGPHQRHIRTRRAPPKLWNEVAERLTYIDGRPILVRFFLIEDTPTETQSGVFAEGNDIHSLLSGTLEQMVDAHLKGKSLAGPAARVDATVLRVGPIEIDLIDRTAKRGNREIDLRPREFQLLKYMMQRSEQLLTRATLLKDVWRYKFVPETNLVDVHMGRLRRKVDAPNEPPMIRNVRGLGFILEETPCLPDSPSKPALRPSRPDK